MAVSKEKLDALAARMKTLGIDPDDLEEKFVLSSGPGGQKVNKTSSTVFLKYKHFEIKCSQDRSREINRYLARRELCERIEKEQFGIPTPQEIAAAKKAKQKKRRSRRSKNLGSN